jgi:hypothetical protein
MVDHHNGEAPYSIKADFTMPPTRMSDNTAMSLSQKLQNGSVPTGNNSLNNDEKIPDASKNKSINDKLMSPYIPKTSQRSEKI